MLARKLYNSLEVIIYLSKKSTLLLEECMMRCNNVHLNLRSIRLVKEL